MDRWERVASMKREWTEAFTIKTAGELDEKLRNEGRGAIEALLRELDDVRRILEAAK